jgi:hypothetical protein
MEDYLLLLILVASGSMEIHPLSARIMYPLIAVAPVNQQRNNLIWLPMEVFILPRITPHVLSFIVLNGNTGNMEFVTQTQTYLSGTIGIRNSAML